jgi:hypothetical protein
VYGFTQVLSSALKVSVQRSSDSPSAHQLSLQLVRDSNELALRVHGRYSPLALIGSIALGTMLATASMRIFTCI